MEGTIRDTGYNFTQVNNDFIDGEMLSANGEYVKVYLLLLRYAGDRSLDITEAIISKIADKLDCPEKDVLRALEYWEKKGILEGQSLKEDESKKKEKVEMGRLLVMATKHMGCQLTMSNVNDVYYIYHDLGFSYELTNYLFEYCARKGKTNISYIKKVAENWHENKVTTVQQAKDHTDQNYVFCYKVLSAFGIKGRNAAQVEIDYCNKWVKELGFSQEMVLKACERVMLKTHKPSFVKADEILNEWKKLGIIEPGQLSEYDEMKKAKKSSAKPVKAKPETFEREYDMSALEKQLLNIT